MSERKFKIFIASAKESKQYAEEVTSILEEISRLDEFSDIEIYPWWNIFVAGKTTIDTILETSRVLDAGIFILGKDDFICNEKKSDGNRDLSKGYYIARDNVLIEAGIFMGMKEKSNICLFPVGNVSIPSDFRSITYIPYDESKPTYTKKQLMNWLENAKKNHGQTILADRHGIDGAPPVFIDKKKFIETKLPLEDRVKGAKVIRIVNYAGTSLLTNSLVGKLYNESWEECFEDSLQGGVIIIFVLTKINTPAANDAAMYKMYPPHGNEIDRYDIIPENRKKLVEFKKKYGNINLSARETEIALPYALFETIFDDKDKNHIKVDLYSPLISNDDERPSFIVYKKDNPDLYNHFSRVIDNIIDKADLIS